LVPQAWHSPFWSHFSPDQAWVVSLTDGGLSSNYRFRDDARLTHHWTLTDIPSMKKPEI
jgi:hypothetical protein